MHTEPDLGTWDAIYERVKTLPGEKLSLPQADAHARGLAQLWLLEAVRRLEEPGNAESVVGIVAHAIRDLAFVPGIAALATTLEAAGVKEWWKHSGIDRLRAEGNMIRVVVENAYRMGRKGQLLDGERLGDIMKRPEPTVLKPEPVAMTGTPGVVGNG